MGWAVGFDRNWGRDIGYGVPARCDQPGCEAEIDRGLSYVCGGEPFGLASRINTTSASIRCGSTSSAKVVRLMSGEAQLAIFVWVFVIALVAAYYWAIR